MYQLLKTVNYNISFNCFGVVADWRGSVVVRERNKYAKGPGSILSCECLSF